jgi:DNA-binding transcriptional regulator YdaS (Cro superfamily)
MKLTEYFEREGRGAASRLASAIGAYASDVSDWGSGKRPIPVKAAVAIEKATGGDVRRWDMFPEDWHRIWPELIGQPGAPAVADTTPASA